MAYCSNQVLVKSFGIIKTGIVELGTDSVLERQQVLQDLRLRNNGMLGVWDKVNILIERSSIRMGKSRHDLARGYRKTKVLVWYIKATCAR